MSDFEKYTILLTVISILIAFVSIAIAIVSYRKANYYSKNSLTTSQIQNLIAMGGLENSISERISSTRNRVADLTIQFGSNTNQQLNDLYNKVYNDALENNLNAYDDACGKYLDSKVDVERFKKKYFKEIRQLVEDRNFKKYFDATTSSYKAILKVYTEWYDLEK